MAQYASRTTHSGRRLKKAIHPILMRLLSYQNCIGTFVTLQFRFCFPELICLNHDKRSAVDKLTRVMAYIREIKFALSVLESGHY